MIRRASLAFAIWSFSIAAQALVPNGHDDFISLDSSKANWTPQTGPSAPLDVGNGLLRLSVASGDTSSRVGGWQWNNFVPGNGDWSFEAVISMPDGLVAGSDFVILGLQLQGTFADPDPMSPPGTIISGAVSDYIQLTADAQNKSVRDALAAIGADTVAGQTHPDPLSAVRFDFHVTDPNTHRGTLLAQYSPDGSQSWTTLTSLSQFALDGLNPVIFVFSQSQIASGNGIAPSANLGVESVQAVPEPSAYAFGLAAMAVMAWLSAIRARRFLQTRSAK
jgi:hypothetical protein